MVKKSDRFLQEPVVHKRTRIVCAESVALIVKGGPLSIFSREIFKKGNKNVTHLQFCAIFSS
jgi:hypothetical protein